MIFSLSLSKADLGDATSPYSTVLAPSSALDLVSTSTPPSTYDPPHVSESLIEPITKIVSSPIVGHVPMVEVDVSREVRPWEDKTAIACKNEELMDDSSDEELDDPGKSEMNERLSSILS